MASNLRSHLKRMLRDWIALDLRSLALFRISIASVILFDLWVRSRDLVAFYTDDGALPRDVYIGEFNRPWWFSIHMMFGEPPQIAALFVINAILAALLLVGYRTRLMTVLCWIMLTSLHNRNYMVLNGGDTLFRLLLFWSMFLPLGTRVSLDRLRGKVAPRLVQNNSVVSAASLAFIVQVCLVYWFTAYFKSEGSTWHDGSALNQTLEADLFVTAWGIRFRDEMGWALKPLTHATFYWEMFGTLLLFAPIWRGPLRMACVLGFIAMHIGILLTMEVGMFPYVSIAGWLAIVPGWFWTKLGRFAGLLPNVRLRIWDSFVQRIGGADACDARRTGSSAHTAVPRWKKVTINGAVLCFLVYVLLWNLRTVDFEPAERLLPREYNTVGNALRLGQEWDMFSPNPPTNDGWYVIEARLADGQRIDLLRGGRPVELSRPTVVTETIPNRRWGKYLAKMRSSRYENHRRHFVDYLLRHWNKILEPDKNVVQIHFYYMKEHVTDKGYLVVLKTILWKV